MLILGWITKILKYRARMISAVVIALTLLFVSVECFSFRPKIVQRLSTKLNEVMNAYYIIIIVVNEIVSREW